MAAATVFLMDVRLLGRGDTSCNYYAGPTGDCPPLPKLGERVDYGGVSGTVAALTHEREDFPGYVVYHLDILTDLSPEDEDDRTASEGRLQASGKLPKLKNLLGSLRSSLDVLHPSSIW